MKVTKVLAALCVALLATAAGSEGVADENRDVSSRRLRQEFAAKPGETGGVLKDSTNPLRRRDQALVSAHRVYDPASGLACSLVGDCVACPRSERDESFCRETGYRQELDCPRPKDPKDAALLTRPEDERETRFKACSPGDTSRPGVAVVKFEVRGEREQKR
nr:RxLR effector protein 69c [Phytophthora cinnamomi]